MPSQVTERKLFIPGKDSWVEVKVPAIDCGLHDGSSVYVPDHTIQVDVRYPAFANGVLASDMTQKRVADFLRDHNRAYGTKFRYPTLSEDEYMRRKFGKMHKMFDENFERSNTREIYGYIADFTTRSNIGTVEGVKGQRLVTRVLHYRLPDGDQEVGVITIAPSGMVPMLSRTKLEKMIGAKGLDKLGELRGCEIYETGDDIVDVRTTLGYPQFTLEHSSRDNEDRIVPHSHHFYRPDQNCGDTVGMRLAYWDHRSECKCFRVYLDISPNDSHVYRSFPLVSENGVKLDVMKL